MGEHVILGPGSEFAVGLAPDELIDFFFFFVLYNWNKNSFSTSNPGVWMLLLPHPFRLAALCSYVDALVMIFNSHLKGIL